MIPASMGIVYPLIVLIAIFGPILLLLKVLLNIRNLKAEFNRRKFLYSFLLALVLLSDLLFAHSIYTFNQIEAVMTVERKNKAAREKLILQMDRPYGEFILPKGTYIERYDPFDSGQEHRDFRLTGLKLAKFTEPTKMAGLWALSYRSLGRIQLSEDQVINGQLCKKNQIALFSIPTIKYDTIKEFTKEEPDGIDARFKPSQWIFSKCL